MTDESVSYRASRPGWKPPETCRCKVCARTLAWHADDSVRQYGVAHDDQHGPNGEVTCAVCRNQPGFTKEEHDPLEWRWATSQVRIRQAWNVFRDDHTSDAEREKCVKYVWNAMQLGDARQRIVAADCLIRMRQVAELDAAGLESASIRRKSLGHLFKRPKRGKRGRDNRREAAGGGDSEGNQ